MAFIFGGNTGNTPESVARQRAIAAALAQQNGTAPQNVGEGLTAIGRALAYKGLSNEAATTENQGREAANTAFAQMFANGATPNTEQLIGTLNDPWESDGQSAVAKALIGQQFDPDKAFNEQKHGLDLKLEQAQIDGAGVPAGYRRAASGDGYEAVPHGPADPTNPLNQTRTETWMPLTADDAKSMGLGSGAWQRSNTGKIDQIGGQGTNVTLNAGENSNPFQKKADETAATRMSDYIDSGHSAQQMVGDLSALTEIGKHLNTGKGAQIINSLGPYAEALGIKIDGLGETQAYQAIIDRLAPQMRAPGSGSSSDTDVRMFLSSLPQLGNSPEGNQIITDTFSSIQQSKVAAAEIASKALSGEITWQKADEQIRALGDPYKAFSEYRKRNEAAAAASDGTAPPKAGDIVDGYRFKGGDPAKQSNWEKT